MMRAAVLGAGSWGTALALALARNKTPVRLWARNSDTYKNLLLKRANEPYLPGVKIPEQVRPTNSLGEALQGAELVILAVPPSGLRELAAAIRGMLPSRPLLVSGAKGLEGGTGLCPSQILEQELKDFRERIAVISGPAHAEELARGLPTAVVAAAGNPEPARQIAEMLAAPALQVYTGGDLVGVEVGGALAGMFALGAGIMEGLGLGESARAILAAGGFREMLLLGEALGGHRETLSGLAGLGDLVAGCFSRLPNRNREAGIMLARGRLPGEGAPGSKAAAEGIFTARAVGKLAAQHRLEMPIAREIGAVLFEGKPPREAAEAIMHRQR